MSFSWLLLLPALAGILIFQGTWLIDSGTAKFRSSTFQRRLKAKVLIHRSLIVTLLLATFIVFRSSLTVLPDIVQGLLITAVLMLPVLFYLLILRIRAPVDQTIPIVDADKEKLLADEQSAPSTPSTPSTPNSPNSPNSPKKLTRNSESVVEDKVSTDQLHNDTGATNKQSRQSARKVSLHERGPMVSSSNAASGSSLSNDAAQAVDQPAIQPAKPEHSDQSSAILPIGNQDAEPSDANSESVFDQTLNFDLTLSVEEQMRNLNNAVGHVDIGHGELDISDDVLERENNVQAGRPQQNTVIATQENTASGKDLRIADQETMPETKHGEMTKRFVGLQKDNARLQRLVVAQQAVIETEKQNVQRSKDMARDAVALMRKAKEDERIAIKFARHERRKRLRLEADNASILKQLENALSTKRPNESVDI